MRDENEVVIERVAQGDREEGKSANDRRAEGRQAYR